MLLESLTFASVSTVVVLAQTMDVNFFTDNNCNDMAAQCPSLPPGWCCSIPTVDANGNDIGFNLFESVQAVNFNGLADGTQFNVATSLNGDPCAVQAVQLLENQCFQGGTADVSGGFYLNFANIANTRGLRKRKCSSTRTADIFVFKRGGVEYSLSARNETHVAALKAAGSLVKRGDYIVENHENKRAVKL